MSQTIKKIKHAAKSAAIILSTEEEQIYSKEIETIFNLIQSLPTINTHNVDPLLSVGATSIQMREDLAFPQEKLSSCKMQYDYFVTPKFVSN